MCTVSSEVETKPLQDEGGKGCMEAFSSSITNRNKQGSLFNLLPCKLSYRGTMAVAVGHGQLPTASDATGGKF